MSEMITLVNITEALGFSLEDEECIASKIQYACVQQVWCFAGHLFIASRRRDGVNVLEAFHATTRSNQLLPPAVTSKPIISPEVKRRLLVELGNEQIVNVCCFKEGVTEYVFAVLMLGKVLVYAYDDNLTEWIAKNELQLCGEVPLEGEEHTLTHAIILEGQNILIWCEMDMLADSNILTSKMWKCLFTFDKECNVTLTDITVIIEECPPIKNVVNIDKAVVIWPDKPSPAGIFLSYSTCLEVKKVGRGKIFSDNNSESPVGFKNIMLQHLGAWVHDQNAVEFTIILTYKCGELLLCLTADGHIFSVDRNGESKKLFTVQHHHMADLVTIVPLLEQVFLAVLTRSMVHIYVMEKGTYVTTFDITEYGKIYKVFQCGNHIKIPLLCMGKGVYQLRLKSPSEMIGNHLKVEGFHKTLLQMNSVHLAILVALEESYKKKNIFPVEEFLNEGTLPMQNSALLLSLSQQALDKGLCKETVCQVEEMFQHLYTLVPERRSKLTLFLKPLTDGYLMLTQAIHLKLQPDVHDGN